MEKYLLVVRQTQLARGIKQLAQENKELKKKLKYHISMHGAYKRAWKGVKLARLTRFGRFILKLMGV